MAIETDIDPVFGDFRPSGSPERDLADLATTQDGVVSDGQLFALGLGRKAVQHRVNSARLHRIHLGVYAVGHRGLSLRARWRAALMACGPGALLSHRDCAHLRDALRSSRRLIDVTVPTDRARRVEGVEIHVSRRLEPLDRDEHDDIPCVSVALMLLNLAAVEPRRRLERAVDECEVHRLIDMRAIDELLERSRGCRGAARLRALFDEHLAGTTLTREGLEERFLVLCRSAGLPPPRVNEDVAGATGQWWEVDFLWPSQRLVVETDGNRFHSTRRAIERDRRKEADLVRAGYRVLRVTWSQIEHTPEVVVLMLRAALAG